jgi:hypothetical protein
MPTPLRSHLAALLLFCCAGLAQAQFVWIGPNGTRQYSDQPPPPGTPPSKILKAPGRPATAEEVPAQQAPESAPAAGAAKATAAPTLAEREAAYRKRNKEREESERKAQRDAERAAEQAAYCEGLRKNTRMLESGIRIGDIGPDGQHRYLNDAERAARSEANARQLRDCR